LIYTNQYQNYTFKDEVVRYKGRVVGGATQFLREQIIKSAHDFYIEGYAGI
jgi:hypothetical protein